MFDNTFDLAKADNSTLASVSVVDLSVPGRSVRKGITASTENPIQLVVANLATKESKGYSMRRTSVRCEMEFEGTPSAPGTKPKAKAYAQVVLGIPMDALSPATRAELARDLLVAVAKVILEGPEGGASIGNIEATETTTIQRLLNQEV